MTAPAQTGEAVKRTVLVVEDDESIAMGLELNLTADGYAVKLAADGGEGLRLAREGGVDLVILDLMLPNVNGLEVLRTLRQEGSQVPVLMLSARGAETDKVLGLELGAEDYVTKPFGVAELLARVKVLLRRANPESRTSPTLRVGDVELDPTTREVRRTGERIDLTVTEFDILRCLVEARGRVLSREAIQEAVWGRGHHGTVRTIDNFILQLRTKLEESPTSPKRLLTVRGVGYRLV
jgi:two-component system alkaline phosphatase synthesis response regulator PhoP